MDCDRISCEQCALRAKSYVCCWS